MANVVITDTDKAGWIKIAYNDYYPTSVDHSVQFQRKTDISAVDLVKYGNEECMEVMNSNSFPQYFTNDLLDVGFFIVDSINGVAPTSLTDLRDKFLALL
jgi:hypothetical protein